MRGCNPNSAGRPGNVCHPFPMNQYLVKFKNTELQDVTVEAAFFALQNPFWCFYSSLTARESLVAAYNAEDVQLIRQISPLNAAQKDETVTLNEP